jgi:hypothetical protein
LIELKEDDADTVGAMLQFMYTFEYDSGANDQERISPMLFNGRVYSIAEKYDALTLKQSAQEKFKTAVGTGWGMDDFPQVIREVYKSTPPNDRGLRDVVAKVAHEHIQDLLKKSDFHVALEEAVGFAADITRLQAQYLKKYQCPNCYYQWEAVLTTANYYYCLRCGKPRSDWVNHIPQC